MVSIAEPLERSLDGLPDAIGPAVDAAIFSGLEINVEAELGGDDDLVAERPQRFADDVLVGEWAVNFGRVEEGHAAVHRRADQGHALVLGEFRGVAETDPHAAETNGRNLEAAAAEFTRFHVVLLSIGCASCRAVTKAAATRAMLTTLARTKTFAAAWKDAQTRCLQS